MVLDIIILGLLVNLISVIINVLITMVEITSLPREAQLVISQDLVEIQNQREKLMSSFQRYAPFCLPLVPFYFGLKYFRFWLRSLFLYKPLYLVILEEYHKELDKLKT